MKFFKIFFAQLPSILFFFFFLLNLSIAQNSKENYLHGHNIARAQVGVKPLIWNTAVASYAQRYANERASEDCNLEHSRGPYGENIAEGGGVFSGWDAVNMWVGEKKYYDYGSNSCVGDECLHYTQVVWRNSIHLGCGRAKCSNGWWFVTCNYDPPGNYQGQRPY